MLTEIYIEALLVDEELADQVWELWHVGVITDEMAAWAIVNVTTGKLADKEALADRLIERMKEFVGNN